MIKERFWVTSNPKYLSVVFDERQKKHYIGTDLEDLLNEQDRKIRQLEKSIEQREEQISIIKKHCLKFLTDGQFETIRKELEDE